MVYLSAHRIVSLFIPYIREYVANMLFDRSGYVFGTDTWNEFSMFYYFAGFNGYLLLGHYLKEGGNGNALKIFWPFSGSSKDDRLTNDWSVWKTFLICAVMFAIGYYVGSAQLPPTRMLRRLRWNFTSHSVVRTCY